MPDINQIFVDLGTALAGQLLVYVLCFALFRKTSIYDREKGTLIEHPPLSAKLDAIDGIFCQPFFIFLAGLAISAAYELGVTDSEGRLLRVLPAACGLTPTA